MSLLRRQDEPGDRFRFLMLETVREYALERLEGSDESGSIHGAHAAWFLAFAEQTELAPITPGQEIWLDLLEAERGNVRSALSWLERSGEADLTLRLATALRWFWYVRGPYGEARQWLGGATARNSRPSDLVTAKAVGMLGLLTIYQGDLDRASDLIAKSLELCREANDTWETGCTLLMFGRVAYHQGHFVEATTRTQEGLRCFQELDDDLPRASGFVTDALSNLGCIALAQGHTGQAAARFEEALELQRRLGFGWGAAQSLLGLADVARAERNFGHAATLYRESLALSWNQQDRRRIAPALAGLAGVAAAGGQSNRAARLFGAASALIETIGVFALFPFDQEAYETGIADVRAILGEDAFSQGWAAGRSMPLAQAVAEATAFEVPEAAMKDVARSGESGVKVPLSPREIDVLRLLVEGRSDREIAAALFISYRTVTHHVAGILGKLDAPSRTAAATIAVRRGLV